MVLSQPVKIEGANAIFLRIKNVELPVVAYVDNLAGMNCHFLAYSEIELGTLWLSIVRDRGKDAGEIGFYVL